MEKEILIDAIKGAGFKSMSFACEMEKRGFAFFNGNQWNESWAWNTDHLMQMEITELQDLYILAKSK